MKGSRLTPYRVAVLEVLRDDCDHPTAAEIYRKVRRRRPGVAYATIYNALNWLTRNGMVVELKSGDEASRYDPITERHDHLVCTSCGTLVDSCIELPHNIWTRAARRAGFRVEQYRLELYGLCPRCARKPARRSA
jgi:Fur family ferric uptake transcriptional regulator/Fur family peroxide stress response transcriptional regulator